MYIPIDNSDKSLNFWDKIRREWLREKKKKCDCEKKKKVVRTSSELRSEGTIQKK